MTTPTKPREVTPNDADLVAGQRVRRRYQTRSLDGTVERVEANQFLVAFDDRSRQWFERADLDAPGGLTLTRCDSRPPAAIDPVDALGALAELRHYFLACTNYELGMPSDPRRLVRLACAAHATLSQAVCEDLSFAPAHTHPARTPEEAS